MNTTHKLLAFLASLVITASLFAQKPEPKDPEELVQVRKQFAQKRADAVKPVNAAYKQQLEQMIRSYTQKNQLDAALAVRKELDLISGSASADHELKKALLDSNWSWVHPSGEADVYMTFRDNGTVSHRGMSGTWKITGYREVKLIEKDGQTKTLRFSTSLDSYTTVGDPLQGRRVSR